MIIFNKLFAYLAEHDISRKELSEKSGVSLSVINDLRYNRKSNTGMIEKLCKALNCKPEDILEHTPEEI